MDRPVFVLGTGVDVGKTALACAILRGLGSRGIPAVGIKPMDTACTYQEDHNLRSIDGEHLHSASSAAAPPLVAAPYRFHTTLEPAPAAEAAGLGLTQADLVAAVNAAAEFGRPVVEGPGGASTRLTPQTTTADLAAGLEARVVIVSRADRAFVEEVRSTWQQVEPLGLDIRAVVPLARQMAALDLTAAEDLAHLPFLPVFSSERDGELVDDLTRFLESQQTIDRILG